MGVPTLSTRTILVSLAAAVASIVVLFAGLAGLAGILIDVVGDLRPARG